MIDVATIIDRWPSAEAFGQDIGLKYRSHARTMKVRGSIPRAHWPKVLEAARRRAIALTQQDLEQAHQREAVAS
jgi:hypothetical protein